jgi:hypothetical protein
MDAIIERGATSIILHVQLRDTAGAPVTGLAYNTAGLTCRYQRDAEALSGAITLQDIAALGTYAAPSANTNLRFKEVDATNWPGLYELQLHNDWLAVSGAKRQLKILLRHASIAQQVIEIALTGASLNATAVPANLTQINGTANASATLILKSIIVVNGDGAAVTLIGSTAGMSVAATAGTGLSIATLGSNSGVTVTGGPSGHGVRVTGGSVGNAGDGVSVVALGTGQALNAVLGTGCITSTSFAAGALTSSALADDAIDAAALATDAVSEVAGSVLGALSPYLWLRRGTAQAGAAQALVLDGSASITNNLYQDSFLFLTSGAGAGQVRLITGYDGTTKEATVDRAWDVTPDATTTFAIIPFGRPLLSGGAVDLIADEPLAGHATAGTLGNVLRILAAEACTLASDVHRGSILGQLLDDQTGGSGAWSYSAAAHSLEALRKHGDLSWGGVILDATVKDSIADHVLRRAYSQARVSSDGDALTPRSLLGAIARLVNYLSADNGVLTVRHEDDAAVFTTATLTTSSGANPVTGINPA